MTAISSNRLVEVLYNIINSDNHSRHQSIRMAPADVRTKYKDRLFVRVYGVGDTKLKRINPLLSDTMVRINVTNTSFDKGYLKT